MYFRDKVVCNPPSNGLGKYEKEGEQMKKQIG